MKSATKRRQRRAPFAFETGGLPALPRKNENGSGMQERKRYARMIVLRIIKRIREL